MAKKLTVWSLQFLVGCSSLHSALKYQGSRHWLLVQAQGLSASHLPEKNVVFSEKVYEWSKFQKCVFKVFYICKTLKMHKIYYEIRKLFFTMCKQEMLTDKATIKSWNRRWARNALKGPCNICLFVYMLAIAAQTANRFFYGNTWVPWGLREIKIAIFYLTYCFLFYKSGYAIIQTKNFLSGDPI